MCKVQASKFCDKLTNDFPYPVEKQACHSDPIKKCELESRSRPKKAKKYTYTKRCKPVVREVSMSGQLCHLDRYQCCGADFV